MATHSRPEVPRPLDLVALTADRQSESLGRGSVGTVLEMVDESTALVEFSDDQGRPGTTMRCASAELLVLHYAPQAA